MAPGNVPGLAEIQAWAQFLGIDVSQEVAKAQMLMETDPASVRTGRDRLNTVASGLDGRGKDMRRAGNEALASTWSGEAATAFGPRQDSNVKQVADTGGEARQLAAHFGHVADVFQGSQQTVVTATGSTAAALRMLGI